MGVYLLLFTDAFNSTFVFSLSFETAWFAAVEFGKYNLFFITLVCIAGSFVGAMATAAIGYGFAMVRKKVLDLDEELFQKIAIGFDKYGIYIFLFQMIPFAKILYLFAGILSVPIRRLLLVTIAGRIIFYLYYLYVFPILPSL